MLNTSPWKVLGTGVFLGLLLLHFATPLRADVNLAWCPASVGNRDAGTWCRPGDATLVLSAASASASYTSAPVIAFASAGPFVFACTVDRPVGSGAGCPPPSYSAERFIPKADVAAAALPPPPPPPPPQITFAVLPTSIRDGESVTLTWSATNSPMCHGAGAGWSETDLPPSGSRVVVPQRQPQATQFQFQLSCDSLPGATGSAPASMRVVDLQVPFVAPAPPGCYPFITPGVVHREQRAIDGLTVSAFGCDKPDGYVWRTVWRRGTLADVLANCGAAGMIAAIREQDIDAAWIACLTQPHTPATQVVAAELTARWKPRFVVAAATAGNRPVYGRNADGTRGARLTIAGVAQSIVTGVDCDGRRRLLGTTTRYHAVDGLRSTTGQVLPANSFTVCTARQPPATGWPEI